MPEFAPEIALDQVRSHPDNPRLQYREETVERIRDSLADRGSYPKEHAITVLDCDGGWMILHGHQRVQAAREAGLKSVAAWVYAAGELTEQDVLTELVRGNDQDSLDPIEHAVYVAKHIDAYGGSLREYARSIGRAASWVHRVAQAGMVLDVIGDPSHYFGMVGHLAEISRLPSEAWEACADESRRLGLSGSEVKRRVNLVAEELDWKAARDGFIAGRAKLTPRDQSADGDDVLFEDEGDGVQEFEKPREEQSHQEKETEEQVHRDPEQPAEREEDVEEEEDVAESASVDAVAQARKWVRSIGDIKPAALRCQIVTEICRKYPPDLTVVWVKASDDQRAKAESALREDKSRYDFAAGFERFWEVVHAKIGRCPALVKSFQSAVLWLARDQDISDEEAAEFVVDAMREFAESPSACPPDRTPIHPRTWLNQRRFMDDREEWNRKPLSKEEQKTANTLAAASQFVEEDL